MSGNTPANVTSQASLTTRARVWLESVPLVTRTVLLVCSVLYLYELVFGSITHGVCLIPFLFRGSSFLDALLRVFTAPFFHIGILHILMNMLAFIPMGAVFERKIGSFGLANAVLAFIVVNAALHTCAALASDALGVTARMSLTCSVGFSGVIFSVLVVDVATSTVANHSVFGLFSVPAQAYPWVLLLVMQVIMPRVSFIGHLVGILSGYLYVYGLLRFLILPARAVAAVEGLPLLNRVVRLPSYVVGPQTGVLPTTMRQGGSSVLSGFSGFFSSSSSSSGSRPFGGSGYTTGGPRSVPAPPAIPSAPLAPEGSTDYPSAPPAPR
eukprot:m51a1_g5138 hypothetical protein (325) ;mRNA; r:14292-15826